MLVGRGKYIGPVTKMRTAPLSLIVAIFFSLFRVGLCPHGNLPLQDAWQHRSRRIQARSVDHVDPHKTKQRGCRFHMVSCQKYFQTYQFDENYSN